MFQISPLLFAIKAGNIEIIKILFEYGADVNNQSDTHLITPLMKASEKGLLDISSYLVEQGANINLVNAASVSLFIMNQLFFMQFDQMMLIWYHFF